MRWPYLLLLAAAVPRLDAEEWIKVSSANFTLYTTRAKDEARQTLETFEQTREFFHQVKAFAVPSQLPFTLVAFADEEAYRPYTMGPFVRAFYTGDDEGDYIVMSDVGREAKRVGVHEYAHSVVRHSGLRLPLWLNEGLAEVYSAMEPQEGKVLLGGIPRDRADTLRDFSWMKLRDLIRIGQQSPEYNERERVGVFYAQSCLLAHMLMFGNGYATKFPAFLENISDANLEPTAFARVYGKPLAEIERDLRNYFQAPDRGTAYQTETHRAATGPVSSATDVEVALTLARILAATGRPAKGLARLHLLGMTQKDNLDLAEGAAFLEWRSGEVDTALEHFRSILGRPDAGWRAWWDYARLLDATGGDRAAEVDALHKAVDAKPDWAAARIMLGTALLATGKPAEALAQLRQVKEVQPQRAGAMYLTMGVAALAIGQTAEAREYAGAAGKCTLTSGEQVRLQYLLSSIENGAPAAKEIQPRDVAGEDPGRPILRRQTKKQNQPD